jgi:hypothetical protein
VARSGGSQATKVQDSFTGTDGTALTSHTPEVGGAWSDNGSGLLKLLTNKIETVNFGRASALSSTVLTSADYDVSADVTMNVTGWGNSAGVQGRFVGNYSDGHEAYFSEGTHTWNLRRWTGGNPTALGSYADPTFTSGTKNLRLSMVGSALKVYVDGVLRISVTDATITAANKAGLYSEGGIHNGILLDNFLVTQ